MFHFAYVFHDLVLLRQVVAHPLFDHVAPGHVATHSSLKHHRVVLDLNENLAVPSHPEVALDPRRHFVDVVDPAPHNQTF